MFALPGQSLITRAGRRIATGAAMPTNDDVWYGQSNGINHFTIFASPPPATAGTQVWDATTGAWVTPSGNGIREYLNAMTAGVGIPARSVYGGTSGVNLSALQKGAGTGYYETLIARVQASGIVPKRLNMLHGEGDGNTASPIGAVYLAGYDQIHSDFVADLGLTKATCPMIISSIATVTEPSFTFSDASWQTIKNAQVSVNASYPNIHYSHSNIDAALSDGVHWNGASYGRSGKRYARTAQALLGIVSTRPKWFATAAERVSTTTTRITVVHAMGSDFTPTSGITGFELTGNNGSTWVTGTGAREDATHILLTHSDLSTTERKVRYQHGKTPNVAAPVLDNSALAIPLNFTSLDLVAAGAAPLPSFTHAASVNADVSTATQAATGIAVPGASAALLIVIPVTTGTVGVNFNSLTVTAQPSNTTITATLVESQAPSNSPIAAMYQLEAPLGTTSIDLSLQFSANPFSRARFHILTCPVANLNSTTKVASNKSRTASSTNTSTTLETVAGGAVVAAGCSLVGSGGASGTFTGTEIYATRSTLIANGAAHAVGDTSGTAANASSSVTLTYSSAANITVLAGSWR